MPEKDSQGYGRSSQHSHILPTIPTSFLGTSRIVICGLPETVFFWNMLEAPNDSERRLSESLWIHGAISTLGISLPTGAKKLPRRFLAKWPNEVLSRCGIQTNATKPTKKIRDVFLTFPDAPCLEYLPTKLGNVRGIGLVNIPYKEHLELRWIEYLYMVSLPPFFCDKPNMEVS